jgi:hypothetical protein
VWEGFHTSTPRASAPHAQNRTRGPSETRGCARSTNPQPQTQDPKIHTCLARRRCPLDTEHVVHQGAAVGPLLLLIIIVVVVAFPSPILLLIVAIVVIVFVSIL